MYRHFGSLFYLKVRKENGEAMFWLKFGEQEKKENSTQRELIEGLLLFSLS